MVPPEEGLLLCPGGLHVLGRGSWLGSCRNQLSLLAPVSGETAPKLPGRDFVRSRIFHQRDQIQPDQIQDLWTGQKAGKLGTMCDDDEHGQEVSMVGTDAAG